MRQSYNLTAIVQHEGHWHTAFCPELDIASQGKTVEEARDNLTEALELFLECTNASEIQRHLSDEVHMTRVEVAVA